jgi:Ca2+:H+ antiporter
MSANDTPKKDSGDISSAESESVRQDSMASSMQGTAADSPDTTRHIPPDRVRDYGELHAEFSCTTASDTRAGSIDTQDHASGSRRATDRRPSDAPSNYRTGDLTSSPPSMAPLSPQTTVKQKRPPNPLRRTSTQRKILPHRGEQFSVDDDPSEVEEDRVPPTAQVPSFPPLTRPGSTVRRRTHHVAILPRVDSQEEEEDAPQVRPSTSDVIPEQPLEDENAEDADNDEMDDIEEDDLSDAESFTLRDRQLAINETHPFGIRIWKPALYKKNRSVEKGAEEDIHSSPSEIVSNWLWIFNAIWTLLFGWWLALAAMVGAGICYAFALESTSGEYGRVLWGLAGYLFWPFGKFVKLEQDEQYMDEDQGEGRSISEYERWQSGDLEYGRLMFGPTLTHTGSLVGRRRESVDSDSADERDSLLGRTGRGERNETGLSTSKRRLFGRGQWTLGRVIFFFVFYCFIAPLMLLVSGICWLLVFWIPMGRVTVILFYHLRKRPLSLTFHPDASYARNNTKPSSILICTYRAVGIKYWKYTVDGTNIFLINFLAVVVFVIFDALILRSALGIESWITTPAFLFPMALLSIIPLAYFIGQAVASISAQSSMGMGAAVNAFFSTIVEVYLYCVALNEGKSALVEGSVIGSIFAGILLLPGLSMCFGAIKRKTQRFNVKSASATSTLLLFAVIAAFGPTLFYKIYGSHELICRACTSPDDGSPNDCRQCYFRQVPAINDKFFTTAVRPYCWGAAVLLFSSYVIGLLFTLRTHAAVIWSTDLDEKKSVAVPALTPAPTADVSPRDTRNPTMMNGSGSSFGTARSGPLMPRNTIRDTQLYKRILGQSLKQAGLAPIAADQFDQEENANSREGSQIHGIDHQSKTPHVIPPKGSGLDSNQLTSPKIMPVVSGLSIEENTNLVRHVAEIAATAATVVARDATQNPRSASYHVSHGQSGHQHGSQAIRPSTTRGSTALDTSHATMPGAPVKAGEEAAGGHDAPNWSRTKSAIILMTATIAYAIIAEVLVNTVDVVLDSVDIDEKFLGITLFALVPNTTEFLNGISFAMNGNIALSMEIGSAYALQVCLLQIPALVLFSAVHGRYIDPSDLIDHTFNLIFPQWDMVTVILCVFLLSYMYTEGKSNYFKGSILVMTYLVVLLGFYYSGYTTMDVLGVDPSDTLAIMSSYHFNQGGRPLVTKSRSEL